METKIIGFTEIALAVDLLKKGELVAFPTETVYGLGAIAFSEEAVAKVFATKKRPADNPLIVHIAAFDELTILCKEVPPHVLALCQYFWPGPLTIVLEKSSSVPHIVSAGHQTVAIRMPQHPIALSLIEKVGAPLVAPSANLSGRPSPTSAKDVYEDLNGEIGLILDGGPCEIGIESTVVSFIGEKPLLLRPGKITKKEIEEVLGEELFLPPPHAPIHSPGMKYRHYAPKANIKLCKERGEIQGPFVLSLRPRPGERLLSSQTLYALFREADRLQVKEIEIDCSDELMRDAGMYNRVLRATESH